MIRSIGVKVAITVLGLNSILLADTVGHGTSSSNSPCSQDSNGRGTLFRWSAYSSQLGGPDQDEPLVTDRPDFTEASSTVGLGVGQIEFGYTFVTDDDGTERTDVHSWGEPLLRYGILRDWLELRLGAFPLTEDTEAPGRRDRASGVADLYVGLKIGLTPQAGILPEMALIPQTFVPTGSESFTADELLPGLNWVYSWEVSERVSVAGSTQLNRRLNRQGSGARDSYTRWAQSSSVSYSLTDNLGAYTEWFGLFPHSANNVKPEHYFNGGLTYLVTNDVQWDIRAGLGINDAAADAFFGTGLSWRFR